MTMRKRGLLCARFPGLIQSYQKKNQIHLGSDFVICREQQNYSVFHLSLLQNIHSCEKQMSVNVKSSEVLKHMEAPLALFDEWSELSYNLVFLIYCHLIVF